jgi:GTP-dependent phosphoenolpyruvate carboxykinase
LLRVDIEGWLSELPLIAEYYDQFGSHLPNEFREELDGMRRRLEAARS